MGAPPLLTMKKASQPRGRALTLTKERNDKYGEIQDEKNSGCYFTENYESVK